MKHAVVALSLLVSLSITASVASAGEPPVALPKPEEATKVVKAWAAAWAAEDSEKALPLTGTPFWMLEVLAGKEDPNCATTVVTKSDALEDALSCKNITDGGWEFAKRATKVWTAKDLGKLTGKITKHKKKLTEWAKTHTLLVWSDDHPAVVQDWLIVPVARDKDGAIRVHGFLYGQDFYKPAKK